MLQKIILPGRKVPKPSLLHTHPHTEARIKRLQLMAEELQQDEREMQPSNSWHAGFLSSNQARQPHWHLSGLWF